MRQRLECSAKFMKELFAVKRVMRVLCLPIVFMFRIKGIINQTFHSFNYKTKGQSVFIVPLENANYIALNRVSF